MSFRLYIMILSTVLFVLWYRSNCVDQQKIAEAVCRSQGRELTAYKPGFFASETICGKILESGSARVDRP